MTPQSFRGTLQAQWPSRHEQERTKRRRNNGRDPLIFTNLFRSPLTISIHSEFNEAIQSAVSWYNASGTRRNHADKRNPTVIKV